MSKIDPRRAKLIRESELLAQALLEKLNKQAVGAKPEDTIPKSKLAPKKGPSDRDKPIPATKTTASERTLSDDLKDQIEKFLSSGDPEKSTIQPGVSLETGKTVEKELKGTKYTITRLPTPEQIQQEKRAGDERTAFYVEPHGAPDVRVGSRPGDDPADVPIKIKDIKEKQIGIA